MRNDTHPANPTREFGATQNLRTSARVCLKVLGKS